MTLRIGSFTLVLFLLFALSCGYEAPLTVRDVIGEYDLFVGSEYEGLVGDHHERLVIASDGTFTQTVRKGSQPPVIVRGRWRLREGQVSLDGWRELLTVTGKAALTASPRVQKDRDGSVILLLNPDGNTFYAKVR